VHFHPEGGAVAVGNSDGSVEVFVLGQHATLLHAYRFTGHKGLINRIRWSPVGHWLASASDDSTVAVHDLTRILSEESLSVGALPVTPTITTTAHQLLKGHQRGVTSVAWSPDRSLRLATASLDGKIMVWDAARAQLLHTLEGHLGRVFAVVWSCVETDQLLSGSEDQTVRIWDLNIKTMKPAAAESGAAPKKPENSKKQPFRGKDLRFGYYFNKYSN